MMRIRVTINQGPIQFDEVIEGNSEEEIFRKFRQSATCGAPFMVQVAMRALSDHALRKQVVDSYNYKFKTSEPVPSSAKEFLAFGERAGFVTRL